jgi:hypothetical protein
MTHPLIRRVAIAGALVATLTLAAPAHAAGWNHGGAPEIDMLQAAWQWVASLWTAPIAPQHVSGSTKPSLKSDLGASSDPNGRQTPSAATPLDRGASVDQNG